MGSAGPSPQFFTSHYPGSLLKDTERGLANSGSIWRILASDTTTIVCHTQDCRWSLFSLCRILASLGRPTWSLSYLTQSRIRRHEPRSDCLSSDSVAAWPRSANASNLLVVRIRSMGRGGGRRLPWRCRRHVPWIAHAHSLYWPSGAARFCKGTAATAWSRAYRWNCQTRERRGEGSRSRRTWHASLYRSLRAFAGILLALLGICPLHWLWDRSHWDRRTPRRQRTHLWDKSLLHGWNPKCWLTCAHSGDFEYRGQYRRCCPSISCIRD